MKSLFPIAVAFIIFLFYFLMKGIRRYNALTKAKLNDANIPEGWEKIIVDSSRCEVLFREYYEEKEMDETPTIRSLLDSIGKEPAKKKSGISIVVYKHMFSNGEVCSFKSEPIKADDVAVKYILMNKKTLSLYVDPLNRGNYFLKI